MRKSKFIKYKLKKKKRVSAFYTASKFFMNGLGLLENVPLVSFEFTNHTGF